MRITDILDPSCVKVPLQASDKKQAIDELVNHLIQVTGIAGGQQLIDAVWERENTRTTGIGHGIAIPHGKTDQIDQLKMAVGRPAVPIEFGSIDKKPVDLIFLLVSPEGQTGPHIEALARISKLLTDAAFRNQLKQVDAVTLYQMIETREQTL